MKIRSILFLLFITVGILLFSMTFFEKKEKSLSDNVNDVSEEITIGKQKVEVLYKAGNGIEETLTFGNKISKLIKIKNVSDEVVSFSIGLTDAEISNDLLTYDVLISQTEEDPFEDLSTNNTLNTNQTLVYNMGLESQQEMFVQIDFKSNLELEETKIKGVLAVKSNLTETELFLQQVFEMHTVLDEKINSLNGISEKGMYTISVSELTEDPTYKGVILIDASDIVNLKFYDTITNGTYRLSNTLYSSSLKTKNIEKNGTIDTNVETICKQHTKESCQDFSTIKENPYGGMSTFISKVSQLLTKAKELSNLGENVYIVPVTTLESDGLTGYLLLNNKEKETEYYLYVTNALYMVSGYNVTKYGMFNETSGTIRAYNETAFKVSAENERTVCEFTGFTECLTLEGEKV